MNSIHDIPSYIKNILLRVDWNVPMDGDTILDNSRIVETLPTLMRLLGTNKHVTILTHLGRPKSHYRPELSLKKLIPEVEALCSGYSVNFVDDLSLMGTQWDSNLTLFENIRFWPQEELNDVTFAHQISTGAEVFVNDAFSVSHRAHASVKALAELKPNCVGLLMERELLYLNAFLNDYTTPLVAICGGAKISTKIEFIYNMLKKAEKIILVGGLANTFWKAKGVSVGTSLIEENAIETAKNIILEAERVGCNLWLPNYVNVAKNLDEIPVERNVHDIQPDEKILDLGERSLNCLINTLETAKTIIWNGALGVFEHKHWNKGTFNLARHLGHVAESETAKVLAGGGETVMALKQTNTFNKFTYVSMAGGAFMEFMEGKKLPGIEALTK